MTWMDDAVAHIAKLEAELPEGATLKERASHMRAGAWHYHGGTSWGKKIWGQELRKHLELHGQKPRVTLPVEQTPLFADDIIFPVRDQGLAQ